MHFTSIHSFTATVTLDSTFDTLHAKATHLAQEIKRCEYQLIEVLHQIDNRKLYLERGYSSLFQYVVSDLKLSESVTYNLISIVRKGREIPELKDQIRSGAITLSNARKIVPILTPENKDEWLKLATQLSHRQLEKAVAKERPELTTPERVKYTSEHRVKLELGLSEREALRLRRAQDLVSQSKRRAVSLEETLSVLIQEYTRRNDPLEKAKRNRIKSPPRDQTTQPKPTVALQVPRRQSIPTHIRHRINFRDKRKCTHVNQDGKRCNQTRWLEIHHITPVHLGGKNTEMNLTTLCSAHHQHLHSQ